MFSKGTLEEVLTVASKPTFSIEHSIYRTVIESLVNIGILKLQQNEPTYGQTKPRIKYPGVVRKYEIIASCAFVTEEDGQILLNQLRHTDLDFEDNRRGGAKIIAIAKSRYPIRGKSYIEIHYGESVDATQLQFLKE
jgi:hypothetical protein